MNDGNARNTGIHTPSLQTTTGCATDFTSMLAKSLAAHESEYYSVKYDEQSIHSTCRMLSHIAITLIIK